MKPVRKILIIIQRSNGDVLLSSPLINKLYEYYNKPQIDLLINDDTKAIASTLNHINEFNLYSYSWKKQSKLSRIKNEFSLVKKIYKKYDLSINLTASDRSVFYSIVASSYCVSAVEKDSNKSWWKKLFLNKSYIFDSSKHIILNNISALKLLDIPNEKVLISSKYKEESKVSMQNKLKVFGIDKFIIFHPSAQYEYKIYPKSLRTELLEKLNTLNIPIIITGANTPIDVQIKSELPKLENIHDFIGETNLDEYIALSDLSFCYIGMDTLNMHIAASQNKRVFAIFGPTLLNTWSPWSNKLQCATSKNLPKQTYDNITIFQANMECVACGLAGCDDKHGRSECLFNIKSNDIYEEVKSWLKK